MAVSEAGYRRGYQALARSRESLCIVLRPAQQGDYIAHHLPAIRDAVTGADRQLAFDLGRAHGECHVLLPYHYCAVRAQALADRLNALMCAAGRPILEAEISSQPSQPRRGAGHAGVRPPLPGEHS